MSDDNDSETGLAVALALTVAFGVTLLALGVALFVAIEPPRQASGPMAKVAAGGLVPTARLYFASGQAMPPLNAGVELAPLIAGARADPTASFLISGFHDSTGDVAHNAELAKQRALAVRELLRASGIADSRIVLSKPQQTLGGIDNRQARRVEVSLQ